MSLYEFMKIILKDLTGAELNNSKTTHTSYLGLL